MNFQIRVIPEVGMKASYRMGSDSQVFTIIAVNKTKRVIMVQRDRVEPLHKGEDLGFEPGGFIGHCSSQDKQRWTTFPDPEGAIKKFSLRKNGRWCEVGEPNNGPSLTVGVADEFYDYNF